MLTAGAWGIGLATITGDGQVLDVWYPAKRLGLDAEAGALAVELGRPDGEASVRLTADQAASALGEEVAGNLGADLVRGVETVAVACFVNSLADAPVDALDVYLRLHLLSHRIVKPRQANLDGIFGLLANVAWTSRGPVAADETDEVRLRVRAAGHRLEVYGVDKFPRMTDYVVPTGVRIADADRVRLGAHLAAGTTVMHEGFVNFNAGTLGVSMVEGRITSGVVVGDGSDIGGGASIMGTLSGGGTEVVSIGAGCLLGANSGVGISLGDHCVVEAGCYVTAGTKVTLPDGAVVAARTLSGADGLLFRRHSVTGRMEALPRSDRWAGLNPALHSPA